MNQEIKEQWATALESDEYPQGAGTLCRISHDGTRHWCCLGVLCDLAARAGVVSVVRPNGIPGAPTHFGNYAAYLPREVVEWAGLDSKDPYVNTTSLVGQDLEVLGPNASLAMCNDSHVPFAEIARLIREQL